MATDTVTIERTATITTSDGKRRYVVEVKLKPAQIVAPYLTVDLTPADPKTSRTLSISASVYEKRGPRWEDTGGGQCQDWLREDFPENPAIQRLCNLWEKYHLGDMKSGSLAQQAVIDDWAARGYPGSGRYDYTTACEVLRFAGKLEVPIPNQWVYRVGKQPSYNRPRYFPVSEADLQHVSKATQGKDYASVEEAKKAIAAELNDRNKAGPDYYDFRRSSAIVKSDWAITKHAATYKYGSAWLSDSLPVEVEQELLALIDSLGQESAPEADNESTYASLGITMTVARADRNPTMPNSRDMDHWKCTFQRRRKRMTVYFSKGYGHHGAEPTIDEVIRCLLDDAAGYENSSGDFKQWCREYGYDTDSRTAERTFKAVEHQAKRLKAFLGEDL